jgi:hypothetical protein
VGSIKSAATAAAATPATTTAPVADG